MTPLQLFRLYSDEDGTHTWWTDWQPDDRIVGEAIEGDVRLLIVEHTEKKKKWPWSQWVTKTRRGFYRPDEIRYEVPCETIALQAVDGMGSSAPPGRS